MKALRKIIAIVLLASFGVSYATIDAHSAGLCDESTQTSLQKKSSSSTPTSSSEPASDSANCHCQGSTNCQYDGALSISFRTHESTGVRHAAPLSVLNGVSLEDPSRPPRAI